MLACSQAASLLPPVTTGVAAEAAAKPADPLPPVISNAVPLISVPPPSTPSSSAPGAGSPSGIAPVMPVAPAAVVAAPQAATAAPAAAASSNALVLTVREDSWIEVRREKGRSCSRAWSKVAASKPSPWMARSR
ncbi:hypothetical protein LP420_32480 [Massilia sp. B-10]|nr:hypothetical protein LP420_32480 [Massilia sp. B-10]